MTPEHTIPYQSLNRHGRRTEVALDRKAPSARRKYSAQAVAMNLSKARAEGLKVRLARVQARKMARMKKATNK